MASKMGNNCEKGR